MPDTPRERQQQDDLPSIPDGGLADSMPDWLRRPPAWRTLPDRDVVAPDPSPVSTANLPEADTSVIDPRTFIDRDDLPEWLRTFPASGERGRDEAPSGPRPDTPAPVQPGEPGTTHRPSAFRPRRPQPPVVTTADMRSLPAPVRTSPPVASSWWEGPALTLALSIALLVAIIVIIVLAVT